MHNKFLRTLDRVFGTRKAENTEPPTNGRRKVKYKIHKGQLFLIA